MEQKPWSAIVLGLSLILCSVFVAGTFKAIKTSNSSIAVTGSAKRTITSDHAKWTVALQRTSDYSGDGLKSGNAEISADLKALKAFLLKNKIDAKGITVQPLNVETIIDYNAGQRPSGYRLTQTVLVESTDVEGMAKLSQDASSLLSQGALISSTSLEYFYSKLPELRIEMLAEATQDAKLRAEKIAVSAGSALGSLTSADMGVFQVSAPNSTEISDYGMYDTSSIEKVITAIVHASFSVR